MSAPEYGPKDPVSGLARSLTLLAVGSVFLFLGGYAVNQGVYPFLAMGFYSIIAIPIHLTAWVLLGLAVYGYPPLPIDLTRQRALRLLYPASLAAFGLGMFTLPPAFGEGWTAVFWWAAFPYIATVFGPVVLIHAAIVFALQPVNRKPGAYAVMATGGALLAFFASLGLSLHFGLGEGAFFPGLYWLMAGATSVGYVFARVGWGLGTRGVHWRDSPSPTARAT